MINKIKEKKKVIIIIAIILIASSFGIFAVIEYFRSQTRLILATTTSTYDSGLLDYLLPAYERKSGLNVQVLSLGTGQAITTAKKGDADVLLVHDRSKEDAFVEDGYGVHRACIMYNDFVIVGPANDPASVKGKHVSTAMSRLKSAGDQGKIKFYSRGDESGTHSKELKLWALINYKPIAGLTPWYFETGSGMGDTLTIADQNNGYTLADRGTYISMKNNIDLVILVEGEEILLNPYGAIAVSPEKNPGVKFEWAMNFVAWLTSEEAQSMIANYTKDGEVLFNPDFGKCDADTSCTTTAEEVRYWSKYNGGYTGGYELPLEALLS